MVLSKNTVNDAVVLMRLDVIAIKLVSKMEDEY